MRTDQLKEKTRAELLELAQKHEIPNRSRLTKDELIAALKKPASAKEAPRKRPAAKATSAGEGEGEKKPRVRRAPAGGAAEPVAQASRPEYSSLASPPAPVPAPAPAPIEPPQAVRDVSPPPHDTNAPVAGPQSESQGREGRRGRRRGRGRGDGRPHGEAHRPPQGGAERQDRVAPPRRDDDEEVDPWNSISLGRDPNYGRFLHDPTALGRGKPQGIMRGTPNRNNRGPRGRDRRPMGPGLPQSESLIDRSERGRNRAVERSGQGRFGDRREGRRDGRRDDPRQRSERAREDLRQSGEARRGSGYVPQYPGEPQRGRDQAQGGRQGEGWNRRDHRGDRGGPGRWQRGDQEAAENRPVSPPAPAQGAHQPPAPPASREDRPPQGGRDAQGGDWGRGRRVDRPGKREAAGDRTDESTREALRFRGPIPASRDDRPELARAEGEAIDRVRLVARDPYWLYASWEITEPTLERVRAELRDEWEGCRGVLRVHSFPAKQEGTAGGAAAGFFDVTVDDDATSWYIHAGVPNRVFRVDVGVLARSGLFYPLTSSNLVTTPPDRVEGSGEAPWVDLPPPEAHVPSASPAPQTPAPFGDPESGEPTGTRGDWEGGSDEDQRHGRDEWVEVRGPEPHLAGPQLIGPQPIQPGTPLAPQVGPAHAGPVRDRHDPPGKPIPPGAGTGAAVAWSPGSGAPAQAEQATARGFWFALNTELVVYGATTPSARVTIDGAPVALRPDGTFTVRFALPDGQQVLPAIAVSADGVSVRTIIPTVTRRTESRSEERSTDGAAERG